MALSNLGKIFLVIALTAVLNAEEDVRDFDFSNDPEEVMIAQESRQYQTIVKPPVRIVKPSGVTNSHRPQYNIDSFEEDFMNEMDTILEATTKRNLAKDYAAVKMRAKEGLIRDAVLRALERKEHVGKFAQLLPIVRAMSGSQRSALASLVASQVSTPPGRTPLNLSQVRSMFGNTNTTDLMLPILLDMANLIRRAVRASKYHRDIKPNTTHQMQRRSFNEEETYFDDEPEPFDSYEIIDKQTPKAFSPQETKIPEFSNSKESEVPEFLNSKEIKDFNTSSSTVATLQAQRQAFLRNRRLKQRSPPNKPIVNSSADKESDRNHTENIHATHEIQKRQDNIENIFFTDNTTDDKVNPAPTPASPLSGSPFRGKSLSKLENGTMDLAADATNQTLTQDLPVAEKLRALSRYIDRKATNPLRRGSFPKPPATRRTAAEPTANPVSIRRRPLPPRKLPTPGSGSDQGKCELFTNTLCLHSEDYPTDAIVQSIRRNKAAAGALLADFKDPGEGAVDGVTAEQEAKYTADHYLTSNRRGDTASRDFASAGEAGFMCPSTVKYARPQRARATSGQWKYIVNTGEHTQTLRLEKCLKPKESCTYLTDNFKSKCVQVYNYHRLLTWDQQNGLHMDIFKVPTCCSCHIEGYSVSFPPLGHRVHETSSEHFPGEDLSSEHGNHAFEAIQSSIQRPTLSKNPPFTHNKPLETYPPFSDTHNLISGSPFSNTKLTDNDEFGNSNSQNPVDSYGNTYFPDNFDQASSSIRNVRRPSSARNPLGSSAMKSASLPSYLEPPTPSAPVSFSFSKETPTKHKINQYKRGVPRPSRRPIIKKISAGPEDLMSSGSSAVETLGNTDLETLEDFNDAFDDFDDLKTNSNVSPAKRATIAPKLPTVTESIKKSPKIQENQSSNRPSKENILSNGKKVNYNYHPIIDFFGEGKEEENESIDREDSQPTYTPNSDSEWKPINHPTSRNSQSNSGRKQKHK